MKHLVLFLLVTLSACSSREVLVVYSPHGRDMLIDYEVLFEQANPGVDVQWLDMVSQDVYNRISAERKRPACDVWWGAPSTMFMQAAEEGLLEEYTPSWAERVNASYKDPDNFWYGTQVTPLAIMFNDRQYTRETVPQTWDDLLAPEWEKKITIRKPMRSGTMRTFISAMILRAESEDDGVEWLEKLHLATADYMETPQLLFDHIKRREQLITVWLMSDAVFQRDKHGYPFGFLLPPKTPVLTEGIALVRGARNPDLARKFYEFVTTSEALVQQAQDHAKIPARNDIDKSALPQWMVEQPIDPMPIDWKEFAENEQRWCDRWEREVFESP